MLIRLVWRAVLAVAISLALAAPAGAATYTVTSNGDDGGSGTLRSKVALAADNAGPDTVVLPAGTVLLSTELVLDSDVALVGAGARASTIRSADGRVLRIAADVEASLGRLMVAGGQASTGGNVLNLGSLALDRVRLTGGRADGGGGAIHNDGGALTITRSLLDANATTEDGSLGYGGALLSTGSGSVSLRDVTLTGNVAAVGGALALVDGAAQATTLAHVTVAGNSGGDGTGGIRRNPDGGTLSVRASILAGNTDEASGTPSNCSGTLTDAGASVESGTDCGFTGPGSARSADVRLGARANRGGDTDVLPLGAGSAALDRVPRAGCPATDQRDVARPQGALCDAGAFELEVPAARPPAPAPPAPPAPPASEHELLVDVTALRPLALGATGVGGFLPVFYLDPAPQMVVRLLDSGGRERARRALTRVSTGPFTADDVDAFVVLSGLGACTDCSVALDDVRLGLQDVRPVSFDGGPGRTDVVLTHGRLRGGVVSGAVQTPAATPATALSVRVVDPDGKTLADSTRMSPGCAARSGSSARAGLVCPTSRAYNFVLDGLPRRAGPVVVELLQRVQDKRIVVDTQPAELNADGDADVGIELTAAADLPGEVRGRTVYGTIRRTGPYAPGALASSRAGKPMTDERVAGMDVVLRRRGGPVLEHGRVRQDHGDPRLGRPATLEFRLVGAPACAGCVLELREGKRVRDRVDIDVRATTPSVTRADLALTDAGEPEFLAGSIDLGGVAPRHTRIVVTDAETKRTLADSDGLKEPACSRPGSGSRGGCEPASGAAWLLGGVPANRSVLVTLFVAEPGGRKGAVDSARVETDDEGVTTSAPVLTVPPGFSGGSDGRQLIGTVGALRPYAPSPSGGGTPQPTERLTVRLVDPRGTVLATAPVRLPRRGPGGPGDSQARFALTQLAPCSGCRVELLSKVLEDSTPVDLGDEDPSVRQAFLTEGMLSAGPWLRGALRFRAPVSPDDVEIRVLDGKETLLRSRDRGVAAPACGTGRARCPAVRQMSWQLGGRALENRSQVTVVALGRSGDRLGSARVTLTGEGLTWAGELVIDNAPDQRAGPGGRGRP